MSATTTTIAMLFLLSFLATYSLATSSARITVTSSMPQGSDPVNINCHGGNAEILQKALKTGDESTVAADPRSGYYCSATWKLKFGSFQALDGKRDAGHEAVYWSVRKDGFYYSWDKSKWTKNSDWETE